MISKHKNTRDGIYIYLVSGVLITFTVIIP